MISFNIKKSLQSAQGEIFLDVSCSIKQGEIVTIYGNSGAGKTTILRILAGLLKPEFGYISVKNNLWLDTKNAVNLPPQKRSIGFVFQDYALFPNMTIRQNLEFALEKGQNHKIINELIDIMELQLLQDRKPNTLSGGQMQRVALARSLVRSPQLLLLDEPLSALDTTLQLKLQSYILKLHKLFNLTTILVSHNISEVYRLSDEVIVIEDGKIKNQGHPDKIFTNGQKNGKFQVIGEILKIEKEDIVLIVTVLINNSTVKVIVTEEDIINFKPGDYVVVSSNAFNPIIMKIEV